MVYDICKVISSTVKLLVHGMKVVKKLLEKGFVE